jgi:hypothetical protein
MRRMAVDPEDFPTYAELTQTQAWAGAQQREQLRAWQLRRLPEERMRASSR